MTGTPESRWPFLEEEPLPWPVSDEQTKIELPGNPQVAPVPASNNRPEAPVTDHLSVTLTITVHGEDAAPTLNRLSTVLGEVVNTTAVEQASLSVVALDPDEESTE